ncbi:hypothetical protein Cni_G22360 [Canna indica]|uniref:Uncharacterized protein n=1 Tax=Canna indica TaxID=4628 RepID=A0AAQ3QMK1_9LILI|nr:hypothetical protein Cni_G22360 [Canna indica]
MRNSQRRAVKVAIDYFIIVLVVLFSAVPFVLVVDGSRPIRGGHRCASSPSFPALMFVQAKSGPSGKGPGH